MTPASRFWERGSPSSAGEFSDGVDVCRSSPVVECRSPLLPAAPVVSARWRRRPTTSSPSGLRLSRSPPRVRPWRGPLPPRRISPPPVLGTFLDRARVGAASAWRPHHDDGLVALEGAAAAGSRGDAVPEIVAAGKAGLDFQNPIPPIGGAHTHASNQGGSWDHLRRCFNLCWSRSNPRPPLAASPPPPRRRSFLPPPPVPPPSSTSSSSPPSSTSTAEVPLLGGPELS